MAEPIRNKRINELAGAPTPQNTPATAGNSFANRISLAPTVGSISEENENLSELAAANPALVSMIQGRLGSLVGKPSGYLESLPQPVKDRISGLKAVQAEHTKLEAKFQAELMELEKKYHKLYEPLYERRAAVISGEAEPTSEEIETGREIEAEAAEEDDDEEAPAKAEGSDEGENDEQEAPKGIPQFWLTAMKNHAPIAETITENDEPALAALKDIRVRYLDQPGFALDFEFAANEFFTDKILSKTYYYQEETSYTGDFVYDHAEGSEIHWNEGKNLTLKVEKRKQRNKHTGATRTVEKIIAVDSFFAFFSPPKVPGDEDDKEEDEIPEDLEEELEMDYNLGEEFKEKLVPRAIDWYTGEALDYMGLEDVMDHFDDEDGSDEEDSDEDSEDEKDEEGAEGGASKKEPAECNQS